MISVSFSARFMAVSAEVSLKRDGLGHSIVAESCKKGITSRLLPLVSGQVKRIDRRDHPGNGIHMLDTMTLTKATAALCIAFLVLLLGSFVGKEIYKVDGGHGDVEYAYAIDTGVEEVADDEPEIDFSAVFASADAAAGEKLWRPCAACHKLEDGANGTGPHLFGVVGRDKGAVDGFAYSGAMAEAEGDWTPENLQAFLQKPSDYLPGTKMVYNGMRDVEDRANLIAYLATIGG